MPRIFKGSESTLRLLISKTGDYQALTGIKIKLYTTDIENAIEIIDGIQVCKNIAIITLAPRAFMGMEDGLINYIIDGATEDDVFHTERQSNYMLKSLSYINEDGVATQTMTIESNGEYRVTPNDGLYVDINVNVPDLNGSYDDGFNVGYGQGKTDGANEQKSKLESINITENGTYTKEDGYNHIEVNVPDLNGSYDEGYAQGKTDGVNEQKTKLESISITENGTYSKEDGYNHIEVNVPDLNGSYDEGKIDGVNEQKSKLARIEITENGTYAKEDGYNEIVVEVPDLNGSYDEGYDQGQADVASNARVLNVTENGVYRSKFSDPIPPTLVTGVYADGTKFHNYAELNGKVFNTKITATIDSRLEFWYKGDNTINSGGWNLIIGAGNSDDTRSFQVKYFAFNNDRLCIDSASRVIINGWDDTVWHHLIVSKTEGICIDGEKKGDFSTSPSIAGEFFINGIGFNKDGTANGCFGMIKIDDVVIIPTADGFQNVNTGELLEVVKDGTYTFTENLPTYAEGELYKTINVNVPDLNGSYDEGKIDGVNEQKSKLARIEITENGTYTKEDGYNHIEVNVPDLNGSYDEGYDQGQADVASNARVLNVTENGVYRSKFSDPIPPTLVTGVYADGTDFYNYAELGNKVFNTKIAATENSRLEFWYKGDNTVANNGWNAIIGAGNVDNRDCFQVRYWDNNNNRLLIEIGNSGVNYRDWDDTVWHHLIVSKAEGLWIDGKKNWDFTPSNTINGEFFINGTGYNADSNANGTFGMIKIDDTIIIPTADGFLNTNTGELLEVVKDGTYTFTENLPTYAEGELYKTINVNVPDLNGSYDEGYAQGKTDGVNEQKSKLETINITQNGTYTKEDGYNQIEVNVNAVPKINVKEAGIKFSDSTFTEVPEWADFKDVTDMESMFYNCRNLQTIPQIDTSNATDMNYMFEDCSNLQTIPLIDTSNVTNMRNMFSGCRNLQTIPQLDTSSAENMFAMFTNCYNLQTIPQIDTSNATSMNEIFYGCSNLRTLPELDVSNLYEMNNYFGFSSLNYLTDVGGWKNLKRDWDDNYGLVRCPNLTYQSCINILNGLYDFVGNGSTETRTLKVHANFLTTVGDEISIGVAKGWTISA